MSQASQILKNVENFYLQAVLAYTLLKYGAEGDTPEQLLEEAENIWDNTDNNTLADQLKNLINSYEQFNQAINAKPGDMANPAKEAEDEVDTIDSLAETLNARWQRLIANPYLQLEADDPKYTESEPPEKYLEVAQNLVDDANRFLEQKAQQSGFTTEELKFMQEQERAPEISNSPQENAENERRSQVLNKRKVYEQAFKNKLKLIGKIGPQNLERSRQELQNKIDTTTNAVEREEMERRLKNMPNPESYYKMRERSKKQWQKLKENPTRLEEHNKKVKENYKRYLGTNPRKQEVIDEITNGNKSPRLLEKLVEIEKKLMKKDGLDPDDPFVLNDPKNVERLKPDNIIKKYKDQLVKFEPSSTYDPNSDPNRGKFRYEEVQHRNKMRQAGELPGLVFTFRQDLATVVNEVKKALNKKIDKNGPNDPAFKPYYQAVMAAQDLQSKTAAMAALDAFTKQYKETHPLVQEVVRRIEPLVKIKDELAELASSRRKGEVINYKNPWLVSSEPLPQDKMMILSDIHQRLIGKIGTGFANIPGANLDNDMKKIAEAIKLRIEG